MVLAGTVFALQGDGIIGGSALMSGNSQWIYIGSIIAVIGIVVIVLGTRSPKPKAVSSMTDASATSDTKIQTGDGKN